MSQPGVLLDSFNRKSFYLAPIQAFVRANDVFLFQITVMVISLIIHLELGPVGRACSRANFGKRGSDLVMKNPFLKLFVFDATPGFF